MQNRVTKQEMEKLPYIIAVDFDGTLVEDNFPYIGTVREEVWNNVVKAKEKGCKIILWTSRDGEHLREAVSFCSSYGLHFDAINENLDETKVLFNNDTRKIHANEYWDDKAISSYCRVRSILAGDDEEW